MDSKKKKLVTFQYPPRFYVIFAVGFLLHFRLSSPLMYKYLTVEKNLTVIEIHQDIFPIYYYSAAIQSFILLLLTDISGYNPVIILSTLCGIVATCLSIWTHTRIEIQIAWVFYGNIPAAQVCYFSWIFAQGNLEGYRQLASYAATASLVGKFISAVLAQIFVSLDCLTLTQLFYFDLAAYICAFLCCIFLPIVKDNLYWQKDPSSESVKPNISLIFTNLLTSFPNKYVVKWTIWCILTLTGYTQVYIYIQPLWKLLKITEDGKWNGVVYALYSVITPFGAIMGGLFSLNWKYNGDLMLAIASLFQGFMVLLMAQLENAVLNHLFFLLFGFAFYFVFILVIGEMMTMIKRGSYGLSLGFITVVTGVLNSLLVYMINDSGTFELDARGQFMIYGFYHLMIGVMFIIVGLGYWIAKTTYEI